MQKLDCSTCKYKWWDCKNCYILSDDNNEFENVPNLIFTIVLTRQCNFRCNYCAIDFSDDIISYSVIDKFINLLETKRNNIWKIKFEFFWWEPLLEFEKVKYIVDKTNKLDIGYSIVTNGYLLNQEKLDYLNKYNFETVFSVALHTVSILNTNKDLFKVNNLDNFIINFIIEPWKELLMYEVFLNLIRLGFKKITILPVYYTITWDKSSLQKLDYLLKKLTNIYYKLYNSKFRFELFYIRTNKEFEYNIKKNDTELMLDYDGKIYWDYDTELYLLKDFVKKEVFSIENIFLWNILDKDFSLIDIILKRKKINTVYFMNNITEALSLDKNLKLLWKVIENNNLYLNKWIKNKLNQ